MQKKTPKTHKDPSTDVSASPFDQLVQLIDCLRGENGCPWDRKQTPQSLSVYIIEEAYELVEAIHSGSPEAVREELGDVLFLLFFIASLYKSDGCFDIHEAAGMNARKMVNRHPHVFGDAKAQTPEEVSRNWTQIKKSEKNGARGDSVLDSVPEKLPALMRAYRVSERAARTGFDWDDLPGVMKKAEEEWQELKSELAKNDAEKDLQDVALEFGDVLFTLTNVARFARIHPETALTASIKKFEKRFKYMETASREMGTEFDSLSFDEMHVLWDRAKKEG